LGAAGAAELKYPFAESSLGGLVKSQSGAPLEGIVIRAKKTKTSIAYDVISDAQGQYRFPKLEPGTYAVETARADGLEPVKQDVEIRAGQQSHADFALGPAKNMEAQITSVDWLLNLPGTPEQIKLISDSCIHCHTGTPLSFRFDKEGWLKIIHLMRGRNLGGGEYGDPTHPQIVGARPNRDQPGWEERNLMIAEFLSKVRGPEPIDMSHAKILPRPTGRSTRVMFTEYDIPYHDAELHDINVDRYGMVWWTDWRWPYVGMLNPETGEMKYWESPPLEGKEEVHPGNQEIGFDKDENLWTCITWTGGLLKFDRKTEKFTTWAFPDRSPRHITAVTTDPPRDRVWFHTADYYGTWFAGFYVPDKRQVTLYEIPKKPGKKESAAYGQATDTKGNSYLMKNVDSDIDRIDGQTGELTRYSTPTPNAFPRRGDHDSQDRIWFSEYNAGNAAVLDPKTGKITEYKIDLPMAMPYGIGVDRNTDWVWSELYRADRLAVLEPKSGEMRQYLLPERHIMARAPRAAPNSSADHSIIWVGTLPKYGNGKLIRVDAW